MVGSSSGYFCDTYALIEMFQGNPVYARYLGEPLATSTIHLIEFYYKGLRRREERKKLDDFLELLLPSTIREIGPEDVAPVAALKAAEPDLSLADCIGYHLARKHGMRFLTGDRGFRGKPDVEFVP